MKLVEADVDRANDAHHRQATGDEEAFGWAKTVAGLRKLRHRGLPKVDWQFTLAMAAYDLVRLPKLLGNPAAWS